MLGAAVVSVSQESWRMLGVAFLYAQSNLLCYAFVQGTREGVGLRRGSGGLGKSCERGPRWIQDDWKHRYIKFKMSQDSRRLRTGFLGGLRHFLGVSGDWCHRTWEIDLGIWARTWDYESTMKFWVTVSPFPVMSVSCLRCLRCLNSASELYLSTPFRSEG